MTTRTVQLPRTAMFVDAENHADLQVSALMQRLSRFDFVERHAYADWRNRHLDPLSQSLARRFRDAPYMEWVSTWRTKRFG